MFILDQWENGWQLLLDLGLAIAIVGGLLIIARRVNAKSVPPTRNSRPPDGADRQAGTSPRIPPEPEPVGDVSSTDDNSSH